MKISKVFAGMSAVAAAAAMSLTAFAGQGTIGNAPEGWSGIGDGLAKRILIGSETDTPLFTRDDQSKMADIKTVKVTITGENFGNDDWGTSGSIVITGTKTGWGQHDFKLGTAATLEDGSVDPDANKDLTISNDGANYTISFTDDAGVFNKEDASSTDNYYGISVQNFDENGATWDITSLELLDADGNAITPSGSAESSQTDSSQADSNSSTSDSSSKADASSKAATSSTKPSGNNGTTNATSSTAAASDNTAATGATAGIALAGLAIAGAAVVVSKRK